MRKLPVTITSAVILLCGCAHGLIGPLPVVKDPDAASEIYLVRGYGVGGLSAYVSFDGNDVLAIRQGEYTRFSVPAGAHTMGVQYPGFRPIRIPIRLAPGKKYYFQIIPRWPDVFYLVPITEQQARTFLTTDLSFLQLDNTSGSIGAIRDETVKGPGD